MSGFLGADTEQLREHAQLLAQRAATILEVRDRLSPMVMDVGIWQGPDADAFREQWSGATSQLFALRSDALRERSAQLEQQAEEQDATSEAGGTGGPGGPGEDGGSGDGPGGLLGFFRDLLVDGQKLFNDLKKFRDFLGRIPSAADEFARLAERGLQGLWRSAYLDELWETGKGWQKGAEKLLTELGIPNALGDKEPLKLLNKLDEVAPFLKTGGKVIGKALPFLDVGLGVHQMVTADNAYDAVSGGLSAAGGSLLLAAPFCGPAAPIVGLVGAGLSIGSIGMDIGKAVYENWDSITGAVSDGVNWVGDQLSSGWDAVSGMASDLGQSVSEGIGNVTEGIGDGLESIGSAISDGIGAVGDALGF